MLPPFADQSTTADLIEFPAGTHFLGFCLTHTSVGQENNPLPVKSQAGYVPCPLLSCPPVYLARRKTAGQENRTAGA